MTADRRATGSLAIEVHDLQVAYGALHAVDGISFEVPRGSVVAMLGPNGAGKTSTVEVLEGYRQRSAGSVAVLGFDPATDSRELRSRIGIVLQECGFPRYATVRELLVLQARYYPAPRAVDEVLDVVGLREKAGTVVRSLSGGQARRLDLALALIGDPDLLFLDEPTTGFDPSARRGAWSVIAGLRDLGTTILLTTHYMDEAQALADHVLVLAKGRIVAAGSPASLADGSSQRTTVAFDLGAVAASDLPNLDALDCHVVVDGGRAVIECDEPTSVLHALTAWAIARGEVLAHLSVTRPTLEDTYLSLVQPEEPAP